MAKQKTASQMVAELKRLAGDASKNLYQRLSVADRLLQDGRWLESQFGGVLDDAEAYIEDQGFPEVAMGMSLSVMLTLYREMDEETWQTYRYNVSAVYSLWREQKVTDDSGLKGTRTSWKKVAEKATEELREARAMAARAERVLSEQDKELERLRATVADLERENSELRGHLEELRRLVDKEAMV